MRYQKYPHEIELDFTVPGLVTLKYAAGLLGESYTALDKRLRRNKLTVIRIGDTRFLTHEQVSELDQLRAPRGRRPASSR